MGEREREREKNKKNCTNRQEHRKMGEREREKEREGKGIVALCGRGANKTARDKCYGTFSGASRRRERGDMVGGNNVGNTGWKERGGGAKTGEE